MIGRLTNVLAAAVLAASISGAGSCGSADNRPDSPADVESIVERVIDERDRNVRRALRDIIKSTHCVRVQSEYRLKGAPGTEKTVTRTSYGTAFAYGTKGDRTYLVTNDHVVTHPEIWQKQRVAIKSGLLDLESMIYERVTPVSLSLVDNARDSEDSDDIAVEHVRPHPDSDIHVIRTKRGTLPVSSSYTRSASFSPEFGHRIYIVGYPRARELTVTHGIMSNPDHESDGQHYQLGDAEMTFGNSGSPVFVEEGGHLHFAGLVSRTWTYPSSRTNMFGMFVPLRYFNTLLNTAHMGPVPRGRVAAPEDGTYEMGFEIQPSSIHDGGEM